MSDHDHGHHTHCPDTIKIGRTGDGEYHVVGDINMMCMLGIFGAAFLERYEAEKKDKTRFGIDNEDIDHARWFASALLETVDKLITQETEQQHVPRTRTWDDGDDEPSISD